MTTAVIIPCRNEAGFIGPLLDALNAQTRPPDEVIVVDDQSTDGTGDIARAWTATETRLVVRVVPGPGRGPAAAVNAGIRSTQADYLIRLDGHSRPAADYIERCLLVIDRGVVGGRWIIRPGASTAMAQAIAAVVSHPVGSGGALYRRNSVRRSELRRVETVPFGAYSRVVWSTLGGLDESLVVNEDFDFNFRARQAGYEVLLDPLMNVEYFARPTLHALARQYSRYGFWKWAMLRKDSRALHWRQVPPMLVTPWLCVSAALLIVAPGVVPLMAAGSYPVVAAGAGIVVGVARRVNPLLAAAAVATIHVCWSLGFWSAAIRDASRRFVRA